MENFRKEDMFGFITRLIFAGMFERRVAVLTALLASAVLALAMIIVSGRIPETIVVSKYGISSGLFDWKTCDIAFQIEGRGVSYDRNIEKVGAWSGRGDPPGLRRFGGWNVQFQRCRPVPQHPANRPGVASR